MSRSKHPRRISLRAKSAWTGRLFILPLYIGFLLFFLRPVAESLSFAFHNVTMAPNQYDMEFVGFDNIRYLFTQDPNFSRWLWEAVVNLLWQVPVILIASLLIAVILKSNFHGRSLVRGIFFLPVIIASGLIINLVRDDTVANSVLSGNVVASGTVFQSTALSDLLVQSGLDAGIVSFITTIYNNIFDLLWQTGIQTIIFLAALQSISSSLYEASAIEGATAWEDFWKITVPMISPMIMLNTFYTIIDSFTNTKNYIMQAVLEQMVRQRGMASAMAWIYFLAIALILLVITLVFSRIGKPKKSRT